MLKTDYLVTEISNPKNAIGSAARKMRELQDDTVLDYLNTDINARTSKQERILMSGPRQQSEIKDMIKNYKATDIMSRDSITGLILPSDNKRYPDRPSRVQTPNLQKSQRTRARI